MKLPKCPRNPQILSTKPLNRHYYKALITRTPLSLSLSHHTLTLTLENKLHQPLSFSSSPPSNYDLVSRNTPRKHKGDSILEGAFSIAANNRPQSNHIHRRLCLASAFIVELEGGKLVLEKRMYTVETKAGSLWKGCFSDNDVSSNNRKQENVEPDNLDDGIVALVKSVGILGREIAIDVGKPTWRIIKWDNSNCSWEELEAESDEGCPSKFLIMCLNSIQISVQQDNGAFGSLDGRPFFAHSWGFEFWSCYNNGHDVLDMDGADSKIEKIAWIISTAADTISMKEKEGASVISPFLLYLVPSQEKANMVLQVCKPLEDVGLYTLFLDGVPLDVQIESLKNAEPEFIVSTPDRLLELLSLKAIDISDLSLMVIDGLEAPLGGTYLDDLKPLRPFTSGNARTVIFCDCPDSSSNSVCTKSAGGSVCK